MIYKSMRGYGSRNTTIFVMLLKVSTRCFGHCGVGHRQVEDIHGMAGERHGMCKSNTTATCKSNGKDTIQTLSGTAWQENGMAGERHGMCESAINVSVLCKNSYRTAQ
jgi:hypothetical protein